MLDLYSKQYTMEEIKKYIYQVNLWDIIKTQKINEKFAIKYILNPKYQFTESEKMIGFQDIIYQQPHLNTKKLFFYLETINFNDDDSVKKFDEY